MSYSAYLSDEEKIANRKASTARYRKKNRINLRRYNVEYQRSARSTPEGKQKDRDDQRKSYRILKERVASGMNIHPLYSDDRVKRCATCQTDKPFSEYPRQKARYGTGVNSAHCNVCMSKKRREFAKANPQKTIARQIKGYGITIEDYNSMFKKQNGKCLCCHTHQSELSRRLVVDHCHRTNVVRGLLCSHCNSALGFVKDNTRTLKEMISYLNKFSEAA